MKVLYLAFFLFLTTLIDAKKRKQLNPWLLHKRLVPNSEIQCKIPWSQCAIKSNCSTRLDCIYRNYKCIERDDGKPTPTTNTTSKPSLMGRCKERVKNCMTKRTCRDRLMCVLFRIYQCERLHHNKQTSGKRISKKVWAAKIRKKIQRKFKRFRKYKKKNKRNKKKRRPRKP